MVLKRLFIIIIVFCLISCDEEPNPVREFIKGKHELRKFNVVTKEGKRWAASYFLIGGSASGEDFKERKVSFSWKAKTGEYIISEIEINKIRVRIDNSINKPTVEFYSDYLPSSYLNEMHIVVDYYIDYIILTCKENDYPISININDL